MCGIAGIFNRDGRPIDRAALEAMSASLAHRGPDGQGVWIAGPVGLAHRRLAIRDLSPLGAQPMQDAEGRVSVTYNGEIYNEADLRRALERDHGVRFRSTCDAELIPYGWLHWGEALFDRIEGMYAFALWDARTRRLVLARDGIGIKPLFVSANDAVVRFGSELKALLADPAQEACLSPEDLHAYLAQGAVDPDSSLLSDVRQVAPGTVETYTATERTERRFWRPRRTCEIVRMDEAIEAFDALWPNIVAQHLISDVPVGVLQSGGVDSALVASSLPRAATTPLFTASFAQASHDETVVAAEVARSLGRPHQVVPVEFEAGPEAVFRGMVHAYDGQVADSSGYAFHVLSQAVRREVAVALSGDGGDELFAGYATYRASRFAAALQPLLPKAPLEWAALGLERLLPASEDRLPLGETLPRLLRGLASPGGAHAEWRRILPRHRMAALYGPALRPLLQSDPIGAYRSALANEGSTVLDRCLLADQRHYLPADLLAKADRMSMAHGLELRVPLLDRRVIEFAGRLAPSLIAPWLGAPKRFLREAARRRGLPASVWRGRKLGFNVPVARLLRRGLNGLATKFLDLEADRLHPFLEPQSVRDLWRAHASGEANHGYLLWSLLSFAVWHGR